jgi:hypothetical protein
MRVTGKQVSSWWIFLFAAGLFAVWSLGGAVFHPSLSVPSSTNSADSVAQALKQALNLQQTGSNTFRIGRVELDHQARTVSLPARVHLTNQVVEYALVTEQGKTHESLLVTDARPVDIHVACLLLGLTQSAVAGDPNRPAPVSPTNAVRIEILWQTNGQRVRLPLSTLIQVTSGHPDAAAPVLPVQNWLYNGSSLDQSGFAAAREGSIISLIRDSVALINNPAPDRDNDDIHFPNTEKLPAQGTAVSVIITVKMIDTK